jgi:hypothetical protein
MSLGLREANRIADAAIHEAERRGMAVSVSLCDPRGRLISHQRMDTFPQRLPAAPLARQLPQSVWATRRVLPQSNLQSTGRSAKCWPRGFLW